MSSMSTITNVFRHFLNTRFINFMNTAGALVRPNDITTNSLLSYLVRKVVFSTSSSLILIW